MGHSQPHTSHSAAEPSLCAAIQDMLRSRGMLLPWGRFGHDPVHLMSSEGGGEGPDRNNLQIQEGVGRAGWSDIPAQQSPDAGKIKCGNLWLFCELQSGGGRVS